MAKGKGKRNAQQGAYNPPNRRRPKYRVLATDPVQRSVGKLKQTRKRGAKKRAF